MPGMTRQGPGRRGMVGLQFDGSDVTDAVRPAPRQAALVGRRACGAAATRRRRAAGVDGRIRCSRSMGQRGAAVRAQEPELGVDHRRARAELIAARGRRHAVGLGTSSELVDPDQVVADRSHVPAAVVALIPATGDAIEIPGEDRVAQADQARGATEDPAAVAVAAVIGVGRVADDRGVDQSCIRIGGDSSPEHFRLVAAQGRIDDAQDLTGAGRERIPPPLAPESLPETVLVSMLTEPSSE